jgi:hypothetical protein
VEWFAVLTASESRIGGFGADDGVRPTAGISGELQAFKFPFAERKASLNV